MEFRLLGPLEVVADDGRRLALGGPKQRALLALLLLRANEVVSTDRIVDALWADSPPPAALAFIQNCIHRLRKVLGPKLIETAPPGYVLRVDPEAIDAKRFERLVVEARKKPAPERVETLRTALALWRGEALSDLAYESFALGDIAALGELRRSAQEDRIEAELDLGLHAELLGELEALARSDPARERLRKLQMLALYRSRRQVDALAAYQDARLALIERYGVEPGEELRALERMILTHDPALDLVSAPMPVAAEAAPSREVRKTVTVLFADVAGSTALGERLDPESLRRLFSRVFAEMRAAAEAHGGTVEKFSGDDVMAVFGVPATHEDDALRGIRAAVAMRGALSQLSDEVVTQWGTRLEVRIGLNTGEVIAGEADGAEPFVTGDVVNVAKRIQQAAEPGEILVGRPTRRLAGAVLEAEPREPIRVRNRAAPVEAFRIVGLRDAPVPRPGDLPLIGRADELARLRSAAAAAAESGSCRRVVVVGEPGIGKSRLGAELLSELGGETTVLAGRCASYGEGATYLPFREVIQQAAPGIGDLTDRIASILPGTDDGEIVAARLAGAVGGGVAATSDEVFWAARRLLETLARERPLVVLFEDVHWAEPTFLDLVEYLAGWTQAPVLLLCLARPELLDARPQWGEGALVLEPLDDASSKAFVEALPGREALADEEVPTLLETAGGYPLFIEQLTALASEAPFDGSSVPDSIEALIASRLDGLDPWERGSLDRAAVAGREFWRGAVVELSPENERSAAGQRLLALARRRLIRPDRSTLPGEDGFRFHHVLIRDVAYAAIPKAERARLHERLARWLDAREGELDELVGYHLEQAAQYWAALGQVSAEVTEFAARKLSDAAMNARRRGDHRAAAGLFTRSIALLPDTERRLELECELGAVSKFAGDRQASALLDGVIRRARDRGDRRIELRARVEQAWPALRDGAMTPDDALELLRDAIPVFEAAEDHHAIARAWHVIAVVEAELQMRYTAAFDAAQRARAHYTTAGLDPGTAATVVAGTALHGGSSVQAAISVCDDLLAGTSGRAWRSYVLPLAARLDAMAGRFHSARQRLSEAWDIERELAGTRAPASSFAWAAASVELLDNEAEAAEAILLETHEAVYGDDKSSLSLNKALLAETMYRQGRVKEAVALSGHALELAPATHRLARSEALRVHAVALALVDRVEEAEGCASSAVELLSAADAPSEYGETLVAAARVRLAKGQETEARRILDEALSIFDALGNASAGNQARLLLPAHLANQ